jgi:hypothetical protein
MAAALGRREIALPIRVQEVEDMFRPKEIPDHFVVGNWTLHADLDLDRQWACAMIVVSSKVIQESYISQGRPNLFNEPFAWAQSGVHENVQDNFGLPSYWLKKVRDIRGSKPFWYDVALGAHIVTYVSQRAAVANPGEEELESTYNEWATRYDLDRPWAESKRLARAAARLRIETPCNVIPLNVITARAPELGVEEAVWEYLANPEQPFGLTHRAAADLIKVPYSTLSSKRTQRKNGRMPAVPSSQSQGQRQRIGRSERKETKAHE